MKRSMFDYYKIILEKVKFDENLFRKEYEKSRSHLPADEVSKLKDWMHEKFGHIPLKNDLL